MLRRFVGVVAQSLKPVKLSNQQLPTSLSFRDQRGVAQQCWIRLHSSSNITRRGRRLKGKGKGVLGARETRGPGRHCWDNARALDMVSKSFGLYPSMMHCRSHHSWELSHPFAHHCPH